MPRSSSRSRRRTKKKIPLWLTIAALSTATIAVGALVVVAFIPRGASVPASATTPDYSVLQGEDSPTTVQLDRDDQPLNVLFLGDSVTYGLYASAPEKGFQSVFTKTLEEGGPVVSTVVAEAGRTTAEIAAQIPEIPAGMDLVVVELGTNDSFKNTLEQFESDYSGLLTRVRAASPDAGLICLGTLNRANLSPQINAFLSDECPSFGGVYIPMSDVGSTAKLLTPIGDDSWVGPAKDGAHPNDDGHAVIARRLAAAITTD